MENSTNIKIPKKYEKYIATLDRIDDGYILGLKECCDIDGGCHVYTYDTAAELKAELKSIWVIGSEKEYLYLYDSNNLLDDYRESYKAINGCLPPKD